MERGVQSSVPAIIWQHPCFDERAHREIGRIHLAVAPRCNISCLFCERRVCASVTMQHPGWARQVLSPAEALALVRRLAGSCPGRFVVGIAGPGEPLANEETFETLRLVHRAFPELGLCISTNGLVLAQQLPRLVEVGVAALTVTVNAVDIEVGTRIYAWVRHEGTRYRGYEAVEQLMEGQMQGIGAALAAGLAVKANTVLIPGVNQRHIPEVAERLQALGVHRMNVMPLIPGGRMSDHRAPSCDELQATRAACASLIPQVWHCEQCRADVIRFPH
jgi:nitrogen fixation protein NifB